MKFIIVGKGSIGKRHGAILEKFNHKVYYLSRDNSGKISKKNFEKAINLQPNGVIICTPSSYHISNALIFLKYKIPTFIEKPIGVNLKEIGKLRRYESYLYVGYNLHFHDGIQTVKKLLANKSIGNVWNSKIHFGAYIPDWGKKNEYLSKYMLSKKLGGGVLLTSIHEINYSVDLFGKVNKIHAQKIINNNKIEVETSIEILFKHEKGIVSNISLDMFEKPMRRFLKIVGEKGKIFLDFNKCKVVLFKNNKKLEKNYSDNYIKSFDLSYEKQMKYFISFIKNKNKKLINNYKESVYDIYLIEKIKKLI
tara:strand:- start:168 stop:1091 length:924 start_codon:yes stop_codon:yes gene_type:complete